MFLLLWRSIWKEYHIAGVLGRLDPASPMHLKIQSGKAEHHIACWGFPSWLHESGKCALTAALNKVWAGGSCKLFIPQLAVGRDHPTCCKYPARRRGRGGCQSRVGVSPAIKIWIVPRMPMGAHWVLGGRLLGLAPGE